jgi:glutathione S-transferase
MKLELVSFKLCPFVQRSVITLNYKKLPYEIRYIDLEKPPEWFKEISPFGKVPVLRVDDEMVLFESAIINEFIDDVTDNPLKPSDPLILARNRGWIEFGSNSNFDMVKVFSAKTEEEYKEALNTAFKNLARVEQEAGEGPWFNGEDFSLVDCAYAPLFMRYELLNQRRRLFDEQDFPRLSAWSKRLLELEAVKTSVVDDFPELFYRHVQKPGGYGSEQFA